LVFIVVYIVLSGIFCLYFDQIHMKTVELCLLAWFCLNLARILVMLYYTRDVPDTAVPGMVPDSQGRRKRQKIGGAPASKGTFGY
jgi:hypothetical protein